MSASISTRGHVAKVLIARDLRLFFTQRSRVIGALAQPLLFWLILGTGLAPSFRMPGAENGPGYMEFFFPGVVMMMLLFTSISTTMSVIEDRHQGFMQGVLAAPGSRAATAIGKSVGGALVGLLHAVLLLLLMPLAGYPYLDASWIAVILSLSLSALGLTAVGFVIAWKLDSSAGYHVVMSVVLLPLWVLSGAIFPLEATHPVMAWIGRMNPMSYAVTAFRDGLSGAPLGETALPLAILAALTAAALFAATRVARKGGI